MSEFKPLLACRICGAETRHTVEFEFNGVQGATFSICDPCWDVAFAEAEENRRQFEALIAGGMTREQANTVMIARIDGKEAS